MKKILIINPFGIGDVLFTTPLIESLSDRVEGSRIGFLCNRRTEPLLRVDPKIEWVFVYEKDELKALRRESKIRYIKKLLALVKDIREKRFDVAIDLSLNREYGFLCWLAGIKERIGFNYKNRGAYLTKKIEINGYHDKHIVEYYLGLLRFIPDFSLEKSAPSNREGLQDQTRREFGLFCRVSQILQLHKTVRSKNPGLPRPGQSERLPRTSPDEILRISQGKIGKSSSDLPSDPFGANFARPRSGHAKFGIIGVEPVQKEIRLHLSQEEREWARSFLKANGVKEGELLIGIAPAGGASWGKEAVIKHWRSEGFADVADRLIEKLGAKVIILGSASETGICEKTIKAMRNPGVIACGKTTLLQSAALMSICRLVIANDGGPLHLAVAAGANTVGIFGPVDERVYGQYPPSVRHKTVKEDIACRPCYRNFKMEECIDRKCLDGISTEAVLKAAQEALAAG